MDDRLSEKKNFRAMMLATVHSVVIFNLTSAMIILSCKIQRNSAHQILALAFKMFMAASAALCLASFLLVPSPTLGFEKKVVTFCENKWHRCCQNMK